MNDEHKSSFAALALGALGVVFGDIGTSPLYALKECLRGAAKDSNLHIVSRADLFGILSLIFWALTLVVTIKYMTFIMRADNNGEGGIFVLLALAPKSLRSAAPGKIATVAMLAIIGAALLYGDGMITPAISVLSAMEGLTIANVRLAPAVVPGTCVILVILFFIQRHGTGTVGSLFGPVMVLWFGSLAVLGAWHIAHVPEVLLALSPHWGFQYFALHGWSGIHILASVVLAVTGGEALYADMGHFGPKPIRAVWLAFVMPSLFLAYFGQGAHLLRFPDAVDNPFFTLVPAGWPTYALVVLASAATVIASQALISGAFSLTRQAMLLGYFPRVRVLHTARSMEGQIYIPEINALLAVGAITLVLTFGASSRLAAAYGVAVTGTMTITSLLFFIILRRKWNWPLTKALPLLLLFLAVDLPFLIANLYKLPDGGYVPVLIGLFTGAAMITWSRGRTLTAAISSSRFRDSAEAWSYVQSKLAARVPGTAVFMTSQPDMIPPILVHHVERNRTLHEAVILATVHIATRPVVPGSERFQVIPGTNGLPHRVIINYGFMEEPIVPRCLEEAATLHGIPFDRSQITYYVGRENYLASSRGSMGEITERLFAFLHRNSITADHHFRLPYRQVVELGSQFDL